MTDDHELIEMLRAVDEPTPVPADFENNLLDELIETLEPATTVPPSVVDAAVRLERDRHEVIEPTRATPEAVRPRRVLVLAAAATLIAIISVGALVIALVDPNSPDVATSDIEGSSTVPETTVTGSPTTGASSTTPVVELEFASEIEVGLIGNTFAAIRFTTSVDTAYSAAILGDGAATDKIQGTARAGSVTVASFENLEPGRDYTIQVTLAGPPVVQSNDVVIRTAAADGEDSQLPSDSLERVVLENLRLTDLQTTQFQVDYESSICANGSFVILDATGAEFGRNDGQPEGCTSQHLAVPGMWTPELDPGSTYSIVVTVEANGAGLGDGNTSSETLEVTTLQG